MSAIKGWEHVNFETMACCKLMAYYLKIHWQRLKKMEAEQESKKNKEREVTTPKPVLQKQNTKKTSNLASIWDKQIPVSNNHLLAMERKKLLKEKTAKEKALKEKEDLEKKRKAELEAHKALLRKKEKEAEEMKERERKAKETEAKKRREAELKAKKLEREKKKAENELKRKQWEADAKLKAIEKAKQEEEQRRLEAEQKAQLTAKKKEEAEKLLEKMRAEKEQEKAEEMKRQYEEKYGPPPKDIDEIGTFGSSSDEEFDNEGDEGMLKAMKFFKQAEGMKKLRDYKIKKLRGEDAVLNLDPEKEKEDLEKKQKEREEEMEREKKAIQEKLEKEKQALAEKLEKEKQALEDEKQKMTEEKERLAKEVEEERKKRELEKERQRLEDERKKLDMERSKIEENKEKLKLEAEKEKLRLEKEMLKKERQRLAEERELQDKLEKERQSMYEERKRLDEERKSLNNSRAQYGSQNNLQQSNILRKLNSSNRIGDYSPLNDELQKEREKLRKEQEELERQKMELEKARMQAELEKERIKLSIERSRLEDERKRFENERDTSLNALRSMNSLPFDYPPTPSGKGNRKFSGKNPNETYGSGPIKKINIDAFTANSGLPEDKKVDDATPRSNIDHPTERIIGNNQGLEDHPTIRNPHLNNNRITFGTEQSKLLQNKSPLDPSQKNLFLDTSCSLVSGDKEDFYQLNESVASNRQSFNDSIMNLLPHEKYNHQEENPNDKELRALNMRVNKQYQKKGLQDKISKPKLWDTLALMSNQIARKGDDKGVFNLRRQTAQFNSPDFGKKKMDPQKYLDILAEYLNRMLKQRKKKKLRKQTKRNINRMARQVYKTGYEALKNEEPERDFRKKPKSLRSQTSLSSVQSSKNNPFSRRVKKTKKKRERPDDYEYVNSPSKKLSKRRDRSKNQSRNSPLDQKTKKKPKQMNTVPSKK